MIEEYKKDAEERMNRAVEVLGQQFNRIRTGRAHPSLLDDIRVSYYGADTPLNQPANINVEDGRTLTVAPRETNIVPEIAKASTTSELGRNPSTAGGADATPLPAPTGAT